MRVHEAVWKFAASHGNDYARQYASDRNLFNEKERGKKDSKWLRGHGGKRLRNMWLSQPIQERALLTSNTPDTSFPAGTNGVLDERFCNKGKVKGDRQISREVRRVPHIEPIQTQLQHSDSEEQDPTGIKPPSCDTLNIPMAVMKMARSNYHRLGSKAHLLKLQTEYDRGSLTGVIEATIHSVKHAILLARSQDSASTAEDAYTAVCSRVTDVLAPALGMTRFAPDIEASEDPPSPGFAAMKMEKAHTSYKKSVIAVHEECRKRQLKEDPDAAILQIEHPFFGKTEGIPFL